MPPAAVALFLASIYIYKFLSSAYQPNIYMILLYFSYFDRWRFLGNVCILEPILPLKQAYRGCNPQKTERFNCNNIKIVVRNIHCLLIVCTHAMIDDY